MKRLFIAIPLPERVKKRLVNLRACIEDVRWQSAEQMHLTLKFLGDTKADDEQKLRESLQEIDHPQFSISLKGFGSFPDDLHPKVFWAAVSSPPALFQLQQDVEEVAVALGFQADQHEFTPHVTVARLKPSAWAEIKSFAEQHESFETDKIEVGHFVLFESNLKPDGAVHQPIETFNLR